MFLSRTGSDKNRKRHFESQIKRGKIISTLLPSPPLAPLGRKNIVFKTRVKICRQPDEPIPSKQEFDHLIHQAARKSQRRQLNPLKLLF